MAHPTSYTTFVGNVAALSVTGVSRAYTEPPTRIATADMPLSFPRLPSGDHAPLTAGGFQGGWPTLRCELVVVIHAIMAETDDVKFSDTLTVMDNISVALRSASLASGPIRWSLRTDVITLDSGFYHAVITDIETTG